MESKTFYILKLHHIRNILSKDGIRTSSTYAKYRHISYKEKLPKHLSLSFLQSASNASDQFPGFSLVVY